MDGRFDCLFAVKPNEPPRPISLDRVEKAWSTTHIDPRILIFKHRHRSVGKFFERNALAALLFRFLNHEITAK
jgi:hypothetical protein